MKSLATTLTLLALVALPFTAMAQPTVNGNTSDNEYFTLGTMTEAGMGFGDFGLIDLRAYQDGSKLYIALTGTAEAESNFNTFVVYIDVVGSTAGVTAGNQLPAGNDNSSPFISIRPVLDLPSTEFGLRMSFGTPEGSTTPTAYYSIIDYRFGNDPAPDTYLGFTFGDGISTTVTGGDYEGAILAYSHSGSLSNNNGSQGWEFALDLADIGASASDQFQFFAMYTSATGYVSSDVIPVVPGNGGSNLEFNPDFTAQSGTQATTASGLPVELTAFEAVADGGAAVLRWTTASETNNAGFEVQHRAPSQTGFAAVRFVEGAGTSVEAQAYQTRVAELEPGAHTFRLKQVDHDGTFAYSQEVELTVEVPEALMLTDVYPNPFNPEATVRLATQATAPVRVALYNVLGQEVRVVHDGILAGGTTHELRIDGSGLPSGLYLLRAEGGDLVQTRTVTLMK